MDKKSENQQFIEYLFQQRGATPSDARTIANALSKLTVDLYTDTTERFIFELLQNADDMPNEKNEVNVKFVLSANYLLFMHDGKSFDKEDIEAITDIGNSTKKKNPEQTGYKGIGFKIVFCNSNNVFINSGDYSFSFSKDDNIYEGLAIEEIPWQLKPIWVEPTNQPSIIKEGEKLFLNSSVSIAIEMDTEKVVEKIKELFAEPQFILFLRKIKTIEVININNLLSESIFIEKIKIFGRDNCFLLNNNEYIINDFEFTVNPEIIDKIADDKIVPEKLKGIKKSKLSFACQVQADKLVPIPEEQSYLFTYLPTKVKDYKFPFLVNADFLTTANRESIHVENIWNIYLFEQIGRLFVEWLRHLAQDELFKNTITSLIVAKHDNNQGQLYKAFKYGLDSALESIEFLPTCQGALSKTGDGIADLTGISTIIGDDIFITILGTSRELISNALQNKENLRYLDPRSDIEQVISKIAPESDNSDKYLEFFNYYSLSDFLNNSIFLQEYLTPELILEILIFFYSNESNDALSQVKILMNDRSNECLYSPQTIYFQVEAEDKNLLTFKNINFLHPILNQYAEENIDFKEWLLMLGVKKFQPLEFLRSQVLDKHNYINHQIKEINDNLNFWDFICKYSKSLSQIELEKLSNFVVINKSSNTYIPASQCYLSDYYKQANEIAIENVFNNLGLKRYFVTEDYCPDQTLVGGWRNLFNAIGFKKADNITIFQQELIPFIQRRNMSSHNYLSITKFVFEVFIVNNSILDGVDLSNFIVLTIANGLQPISSCMLSPEYRQDDSLDILPECDLSNQINNVYLKDINSDYKKWRQFFIKLNPKVEIPPVEIVKMKIKSLVHRPKNHFSFKPDRLINKLMDEDSNFIIRLWKTIFLYRDELLKTEKFSLKQIPCLLKNGQFAWSGSCYLPQEYSPNVNIEELLAGYDDNFISPSYHQITGLPYSELKHFFIEIGVKQRVSESSVVNYLSEFNFAKKFWEFFQKNIHLFDTSNNSYLKKYSKDNPTIPCLNDNIEIASKVYSLRLRDVIDDDSIICCINFDDSAENFLGIQRRLSTDKCFSLLNSISDDSLVNEKTLKIIYDDLLYFCTNKQLDFNKTKRVFRGQEFITNYKYEEFKKEGKLLSNSMTFEKVENLFYQDPSATYLPLDNCNKIVKRIGSKEFWNQFQTVLVRLGIEKITVTDFYLDNQSTTEEAIELNKSIENSLKDVAQKIDTADSHEIESDLRNKFNNLEIYFSRNLKLTCAKLNYTFEVNNYYDTSKNIIYYKGKWNTIANAKLIEYLYDAFEISEKQICRDEFVNIVVKNIPKNPILPDPPPITPNEDTGRLGEQLVYQDLIDKFGIDRVIWLNEGGESFQPYDFKVIELDGTPQYYIDAKATTTSEMSSDSIPIFIKKSEWRFMEKCEDKYIVARVYNAGSKNSYIKYLGLGLQHF